jgi:hypothetical protein
VNALRLGRHPGVVLRKTPSCPIAIQLPAGIDIAQFPAAFRHKTLGPVLFFDPTNPLIPLGSLPGELQANFGLLVTSAGGELMPLP